LIYIYERNRKMNVIKNIFKVLGSCFSVSSVEHGGVERYIRTEYPSRDWEYERQKRGITSEEFTFRTKFWV